MSEIEVARTDGTCSITGRKFEPGDEFYSIVIETESGFERRDIAPDAWEGAPESAVCHFKTKMPNKDEPKKTFVDDSLLVEFFKRLGNATEDAKLRFRFVLSLILLRKRLLKYESSKQDGEREVWSMRLLKEKKSYLVVNPGLGEDEITEVSVQLGAVLSTDFIAEEEAHQADADEPTDEAADAETPDGDEAVAETAEDGEALETTSEEAR